VLAVGGSWITPSKLIATKQFDEITELALKAVAICQSVPDGTARR
jgi:2-keto-3-deoxy-6-phosphogluconate aldolase